MNIESLFIGANEESERMRANEAVSCYSQATKRGLSIPSIRDAHPADIASKQIVESRNDLHKLAAKLKDTLLSI
jgi:hypothetical protein